MGAVGSYDMSTVTGLVSGGSGIQTHTVWPQSVSEQQNGPGKRVEALVFLH